jgi:competence protein ComGC
MNHKTNQQTTQGFTLIELILSMTFISILLLTIALTIVQIANIYNKGMITKEVNISSRTISTDLDQAIRASGSFSLTNHYVSTSAGGRLCTGQSSYIWNYAGALSSQDTSRNKYSSGQNTAGNVVISGGVKRYEISLVKVPDSAASYCIPDGLGAYPLVNPVGAVELLRTGDHSLALHYVNVTTSPSVTDSLSAQQLYKVTYVLGTGDSNAVTGIGDQILCKAPGVSGADNNYCNVQKFTIVLRVVSGVN